MDRHRHSAWRKVLLRALTVKIMGVSNFQEQKGATRYYY